MIRDAVEAMEAGLFAQIGLIAFIIAILLIVAYVVTMPKRKRERAKQIPLDDDEEPSNLN
jgi:cbb3-type cytochrome oxidase subunit 3